MSHKTAAEINAERIEDIIWRYTFLSASKRQLVAQKIVEEFSERGETREDAYGQGIRDRMLGVAYNRYRVPAEDEEAYRAGWVGAERPR